MRRSETTGISRARLSHVGGWLLISLLVGGCVLLNPAFQGRAQGGGSITNTVLCFCIGVHIEPMGAQVGEIEMIRSCGVERPIRYWGGGNLYPGVLDAGSAAGLEVYSDWKNPKTQSTLPSFIGVHPWRPAGGTDGFDVAAFVQHDPNGPPIFLPPGEIDPVAFSHKRQIRAQGGDAAWFEVIEKALLASIEASSPDRVNAYHFTLHPGEFVGEPSSPLEIIDQFLTQVVDPLVAAGKVKWATFSQVADAFIEWELAHSGIEPR